MEAQFSSLRYDLRKHVLNITALIAKSDDLENRLRWNNVCIVGVPEKVEGRNPTDYLESLLLSVFGKEMLSPLYSLECAHRVPTRPLPPGAPPRPVWVKLRHYKDRDTILRKAWELKEITLGGNRVAFYPDVEKKWAQSLDVKKRLRN